MSEHELSTMLRDHLSDEPPVGVRSDDAIRTARRVSRRRLAFSGVAAVAALALSAGFLPGLLGDDGPSTARETTGSAGPTNGDTFAANPADPSTMLSRIDAVAQAGLGPYVDGLGLPTAFLVMNVDGEVVEAAASDAQMVGVDYEVGDDQVSFSSNGFAPDEFGRLHFDERCTPGGWAASCDLETLADGSYVISQVMAFETYSGTMRALSPTEAANHPEKVFWGRMVEVDTPAGMTLAVTEYVEAPTLDGVQWQIPVEALKGVATDPTLLDPAGLAHAPMCEGAHTSC